MGKEQRLGYPSTTVEKLYLNRKHVALFIATAVTSIAIAIFIVLSTATPVAVIGGGIVEGAISFTGSRVYVLGRPVIFRALESVPTISLAIFIGASITIVFSSYGLARLLMSKEEHIVRSGRAEVLKAISITYLEYIPASGIIAMLLVTLFMALLRVVVADIVPVLPLGGCVTTLAGRLCLERSDVVYTPLYSTLLRNPWILTALAIAPLALSATTIYTEFELYRKQLEEATKAMQQSRSQSSVGEIKESS
ncbi:MAG: hypothetical protein JHC33_15510 [Ignisphaera sp.]|nr:hypothetical protein [Ignisphaera sp.]